MQAELQTALFQAFDTLNLQRVKTFSVPPVTLCGLGALGACGGSASARRKPSVCDGRQLPASGGNDRAAGTQHGDERRGDDSLAVSAASRASPMFARRWRNCVRRRATA